MCKFFFGLFTKHTFGPYEDKGTHLIHICKKCGIKRTYTVLWREEK